MNKRIVLSSVSIFASLALVTGATFAFFSDEATSTENTFTAGVLTLLLNDLEVVTGTFSVTDMAPGNTAAAEIALTKSGGSIDIAKVGFKSELAGGLPAFSEDLLLKVYENSTTSDGETCTGGVEVTDDIETAMSVATLTVDNFTEFFDSLFDGNGLSPGAFSNSSDNDLCLQVTFVEDADNSLQGETADVTFTFKGLQDSTQTP